MKARTILIGGLLGAVAWSGVRADEEPASDPYAGASETRTVRAGEVLDLTPPGVVTQFLCDKVDELISVEVEGMTLHVRALAPGVTACSISGVRDRDDSPSVLVTPDGGRSGILDYRMLVKIVVEKPVAKTPEKPANR